MQTTDIAIPDDLRIARIAHAGSREGRSNHLVVTRSLRGDRLARVAGDALCRPAARFANLALYRCASVSVADLCPRCLVLAVTHRLLSMATVQAAEQAYAALRLPIAPVGSPRTSPALHPQPASNPLWNHLPAWEGIPAQEQRVPPGDHGISAAAVVARSRTSHPEPMRTTMGAKWFVDHLTNVQAGHLHRSPMVLHVPQPQRRCDRIEILPERSGSPALMGKPVARLGDRLVVSVSSFDVAARYYHPDGFPGGALPYRTALSSWHRAVLSDRYRMERRDWRIDTTHGWLSQGHQDTQIALWMFETNHYIRELAAVPATSFQTSAP